MADKACTHCGKIMTVFSNNIHCSVDCALMSRIDIKGPDECWPWLGPIYRLSGYGRFKFKGRTYKPYRLMCEKKHGGLGRLCAMHSCDNRICCNPNHLSPGTYAENIRDMDNKKRRVTAVGEAQGHSKFTNQDILDIREKRKNGASGNELAKEYGCYRNHIYAICNRRVWKHI